MRIREIYDRFWVPTHLRVHMLRVAGVAKLIGDHLLPGVLGAEAHWVVMEGLLHDLGNVVKFDLSGEGAVLVEPRQLEGLRKLQMELQTQYGMRAEEATMRMCREIGVVEEVLRIMEVSTGSNSGALAKGDDWAGKIAYYADMRVGPYGVISVEERYADLRERYPQARERMKGYEESCVSIERQLQEKVVELELGQIGDREVEAAMGELEDWEVAVG